MLLSIKIICPSVFVQDAGQHAGLAREKPIVIAALACYTVPAIVRSMQAKESTSCQPVLAAEDRSPLPMRRFARIAGNRSTSLCRRVARCRRIVRYQPSPVRPSRRRHHISRRQRTTRQLFRRRRHQPAVEQAPHLHLRISLHRQRAARRQWRHIIPTGSPRRHIQGRCLRRMACRRMRRRCRGIRSRPSGQA